VTIHLATAGAEVAVDPDAGGRLSSLVIAGRERLVTRPNPAAPLPSISWGSFPMIPWVGRMADGRLDWRRTSVRLQPNLGAHAIHGVVFELRWRVVARDERSVELACDLAEGGWPFGGEARQVIRLAPDALELGISVRAARAMPVAVGWHPWFRRDPGEPVSVVVPADRVLETSDDLIPTGRTVAVRGPTDLRAPADIGDRWLDHAYVGVEGPCVVRWPDLELAIEAAPLGSVLVHATPTAICVEPQTAWPDAIRLSGAGAATGIVELEAGMTFEATSRWTWDRAEAVHAH
jgi:aldose 1-epimerase